MKKWLFILPLFAILADSVKAEEDCGMSSIDTHSQSSIIAVETCVKEKLDILKMALDSHGKIVDRFTTLAKDIISQEGLCQKYERYYVSAKTEDDRKLQKTNVVDCYKLLTDNAKKYADQQGVYQEAKNEFESIKALAAAFQNKYKLLASQIDILKNQP